MEQLIEVLKTKFKSKEEQKHTHFFQVDILKTLMIFLVIFDNTIPWSIKSNLGVMFWERISIPIFLIIMGFNFGIAFQRDKRDHLDLPFDKKYYRHKVARYLFPYFILYLISTIIGAIFYGPSLGAIINGQTGTAFTTRNFLVGILPFWGPGNWFLPVIFGGVIILPQIYKGFFGSTLKAIVFLALCFFITFSLEYIIFKGLKFPYPPPEFYSLESYYDMIMLTTSVLYYLFPIGLGMWFSRNHDIMNFRNWFMWILFPLSLTYLIANQFFGFVPQNEYGVPLVSNDYNYLIFPYSAFLFLIAMKFLPYESKKWISKFIKIISRSTYHILLTQILYFAIVVAIYDLPPTIYGQQYSASIIGINPDFAFLYLILNWIICIPIGVFWRHLEKRFIKYIKYQFVIM